MCAGLPAWSIYSTAALPIDLSRQLRSQPQPGKLGATSNARIANEPLWQALRDWRLAVAREKQVSAFVILHNSGIDELCDKQPATLGELEKLSKFGRKKTERYGVDVLKIIERFRNKSPAAIEEEPTKENPLTAPERETLALLNSGLGLAEIAVKRQVQLQTVLVNVSELVGRRQFPYILDWLPRERYDLIYEAAAKTGWQRLKPIKESLPEEFSYGEIRLVVAHQRAQSAS